jgi:hypothetical protein
MREFSAKASFFGAAVITWLYVCRVPTIYERDFDATIVAIRSKYISQPLIQLAMIARDNFAV